MASRAVPAVELPGRLEPATARDLRGLVWARYLLSLTIRGRHARA
jgi:hypothetical protein